MLLFSLMILIIDMLDKEIRYSYNDVAIRPCQLSSIRSRSECILPDSLPLFTAPMTSVVGKNSWCTYISNGITPILPRSESLDIRLSNCESGWSAFSLKEFSDIFCNSKSPLSSGNRKVLVDIANGHMSYLYDLVREAKSIYGSDLEIMVGNIANPDTYIIADQSGVDYIRLGIGSGNACITSSNCSIHYPMASLIDETYKVKESIGGSCKIVADGGIRNYSDIIKAFALGADYVMIGSVFAKMLESEGQCYDSLGNPYTGWDPEYSGGKFLEENGKEVELWKDYFGMASSKGQLAISGSKTKTAEGISKSLRVEYTMSGWVENFRDYLRSAMSYTGAHNLGEFIGRPVVGIISENTYRSVNK